MSLRDQPEFGSLAESIREISDGRRIFYVSNPGNWGDALIRQGTLDFFTQYKIYVKEIKFRKINNYHSLLSSFLYIFSNSIFIYGGGGALAGNYPRHFEKIVKVLSKFDGKFIILPSTFGPDANNQFRSLRSKRKYFFSRDKAFSNKFLSGSMFCHDMAFFLDPEIIPATRDTGYFFRRDHESSGKTPICFSDHEAPENRDISAEGNHFSSAKKFIAEVGSYSEIFTDRLHVAIAGALMQRRVHLYQNSYYKNEAIFEASIRGNYKNVSFSE